MNQLSRIHILILFMWTNVLMAQNAQKITDVSSIEDSEIIIYGTSNVMDYSCELYDLSNNIELVIQSQVNGKTIKLQNAIIELKASNFVCDNKVMTNEFYTAIKGDSFPNISVEFHEFTLNQDVAIARYQENIASSISILLAGEKLTYNHQLSSLEVSEDELTLKGQLKVLMTEFGIKPPTAMMGMIQTGDQITIEFSITFKFH